jgi:prepilin-type N-terminal cleavage/methylation domain-containing protein
MRTLNRPFLGAQRGYSLVELSIALAIVAVIVLGGLVGTRQILLSNSVNNQLKESAGTISKITRLYQRQTTTTGATVASLAKVGVWPAERTFIDGEVTKVRGVIAGTSELLFPNAAAAGSMLATQGLIYTIRNVPSGVCADLVNGLDSMAFAIWVNGAATSDPTTGAIPTEGNVKAVDTNAVKLTELIKQCDSAKALVDVTVAVKI